MSSLENRKIRVAILGSGNIALDLLVKALKSPWLEVVLLAGRDEASKGLAFAKELGVNLSADSIEAIEERAEAIDLLFDATSAAAHISHAKKLEHLGVRVIDMTPSRIGHAVVPEINLSDALHECNVNMVTCGGQAAIAVVEAISKIHGRLEYVEVVSTIASKSAGMATRENVSEYIDATQEALESFCNVERAKTILIVNPAEPSINMQVSIKAKVKHYQEEAFLELFYEVVSHIQSYVPGYHLLMAPSYSDGVLGMMVGVEGAGDYLPAYAGNLDIITCAAIHVAQSLAKNGVYRCEP
ncbi:MAG: acetaldehyde dehydrogenase (acetylating) [Epsilonproteobacteria bacterium]|nr:acetaldehyde dehydrogenase (acetylating) [Campylobacterota bacterium]